MSGLKSAILAIDIGGTSISYALLPQNELLSSKMPPFIIKGLYKTKKGKENIRKIIVSIINKAVFKATKLGCSVSSDICIGSPGKFIGQNFNLIAEKSALNLESYPGEFTNFNLAGFIQEKLPKRYRLIIKNDALGQMIGGLYFLLKTKRQKHLLGQKIAYIGPGTGLGGGFCHLSKDSIITMGTDGHICDLKVLNSSGIPVKVEDVFSGPAFQKQTVKSAGEVNKSPALLKTFKPQIQKMAEYLFEIIKRIHTGQIEKIAPKNNWPQKDKDFVKGTKVFLLGGSIGTKGKISKILIKHANNLLKESGLSRINLIPIPESRSAALYGIALFSFSDKNQRIKL
ncbi:hypothetical protein ACFLZV_02820 [Candidatus Margulisiibacteriota bacterium]